MNADMVARGCDITVEFVQGGKPVTLTMHAETVDISMERDDYTEMVSWGSPIAHVVEGQRTMKLVARGQTMNIVERAPAGRLSPWEELFTDIEGEFTDQLAVAFDINPTL
jgi:hypothetical protein